MAWSDKVIENFPGASVCMWEILVPTEKRIKTEHPSLNLGEVDYSDALDAWKKRNSYTTRYHRVWDAKVRTITGGLTILTPAVGQWVSPDGALFLERMIPVRIMATRDQISKIIDLTMEYYDQLAVMCFKISDEVILRHRP